MYIIDILYDSFDANLPIVCRIFAEVMRIDSTDLLVERLKLKQYKRAVITTHHKPDGDAMGSSLGLYGFLKQMIDQVYVITPTDYADFLSWLPENDSVIIYEGNESRVKDLLKETDLVFCLDFNRLSRINQLGELIGEMSIDKVMIDHHLDPENFSTFTYWDNHSSSTCELVFEWIEDCFGPDFVTQPMADCFYTGLMTDTGNFQHNNTKPKTHIIAAKLMEHGAQHIQIHERIYDVFSPDRSRLFGYCLYHKMELIEDGKVALMSLNKEELEMFNVKTGDTEGLVNFGLSILGVVMSVLIIDRTERVKMSFRSKGDFAVNEYSAKYFSGGGHKNASGGQSEDTLENTILKFKETIKNYKEELNK
jgi:phosphoesterase RecJ-like protein